MDPSALIKRRKMYWTFRRLIQRYGTDINQVPPESLVKVIHNLKTLTPQKDWIGAVEKYQKYLKRRGNLGT